MQINLHRRSRPEGVSGAVFSAYSWYFSYRPSAAQASTAAQDSPGLLGVRRGAGAAQILVTRAVLVTALVTDLVTGFSSNRYVFL